MHRWARPAVQAGEHTSYLPGAMKLACPECAAPISTSDLQLETSSATCRRCKVTFPLQLHPSRAPVHVRPELPPGLRLIVGEPEAPRGGTYRDAMRQTEPLVIERRWLQPQHFFFLFFAIIWNAFLVNFYDKALASGEWLMIVFPIGHVAAGAVISYIALTGLLNRTTLRVADERLSLSHGPLPWTRPITIPVGEVRQLYGRRVTRSHKGQETHTWDLRCLLRNDAELKLVTHIPNREQVAYLEWALEKHLGIANDPSFDDPRETTGVS